MAQQHFYSRVPARISIFNKTDGYDTFAASPALTRGFIEDELARVYDNKPTKGDALLIQSGKLPPVYCQYQASSGETIQSCMSFLTHDYTGERSSYLVHSLVLTEAEAAAALRDPARALLTREMFVTELDSDDLTSLDSPYNWDYPDKPYSPAPAAPTSGLVGKYSSEMLRKLIYAFVSVACGKSKGVFLTFNWGLADFSSGCLDFLNTFLQIFPYHLRPMLSFTTYAGDITKFNSFKIRCMTGSLREIPSVKGMTLNFGIGETAGIDDKTMEANAPVVNFFFGLLENDAVRREFLHFAEQAVEKMPSLQKPSMKNLADLVLLFQQCSGLYADTAILPNDEKVYEFVATYEKYREALSDEFRADAFKFLSRYPKKRVAIPKNVFAKLQAIYPKEPIASKRVIMNVAMDFIHTDVMRDKLFQFMKNNFDGEDADTKAAIVDDLCRVYYGGFLQNQILGFFDKYFAELSDGSKDQIVQKLLLTLRTKEVQEQVLGFFDTHYGDLTASEKQSLYSECYKMLPEGDALASALIGLVDDHVESESEDFRAEVAAQLQKVTENDQKRKEPRLIAAMAERDGFCAGTIMHCLFCEWYNRKAFTQYWEAVWERPFAERIGRIVSCCKRFPDMPAEALEKLRTVLKELFESKGGRYGLSALMTAYSRLQTELPANGKPLGDELCESYLLPGICKAIPDCFTLTGEGSGVKKLIDFAAKEEKVRDCNEYRLVLCYEMLKKALCDGKHTDALAHLNRLPTAAALRGKIADCLNEELLKSDALVSGKADSSRMLTYLLCDLLKTGNVRLDAAYRSNTGVIEKRLEESEGNHDPEQLAASAAEKGISSLIGAGAAFYQDDSYAEQRQTMFGEESELPGIFTDFCDAYGKKGKKYLEDRIRQTAEISSEYQKQLLAAMNGGKSSGGFFKKLFGKK